MGYGFFCSMGKGAGCLKALGAIPNSKQYKSVEEAKNMYLDVLKPSPSDSLPFPPYPFYRLVILFHVIYRRLKVF